ncbi:MAG: SLBB domain-containing protein [Bacteroidetes bacterium]|nr:SLBB domain-containing protein [Bacteroidota bacterium]
MNVYKATVLLLLCLFSFRAFSQIPSDLSKVKASQFTDDQLRSMVTQARARGLTFEAVQEQLEQRGMTSSEIELLKERISDLGLNDDDNLTEDSVLNGSNQSRRKSSAVRKGNQKLKLLAEKKEITVFGSDLFLNSDLSFEPDLRMATPKNYVIGPEDQLSLNIYGVNMSQQNVTVTPEGTVNIKYAGVVNVNGMTIESATNVLREKLVKYYPALRSGQTKLQISLGNIRSIRVILIGAIKRPGTYTLPSLASLFNALYVSGGPVENGSFRTIELIRNNEVIQKADLYDFLVRGMQQNNVRLEDNDVIRVPFASKMVKLTGQVNRPAIFEIVEGEHLSDLIEYAGGFKSNAFRGRLTGTRFAKLDRRILDVSGDSTNQFELQNGDEFIVDSLINRYENRVIINGAVFKPGAYALDDGMTVKKLIGKAQGLKEDVFTGRALLVRTRSNLTKEYINLQLRSLIAGDQADILLKKEDSIHVASIFDLRDTSSVTINGAVRSPGIFRYEDSLTLKSLIMKAGGFAENATGSGIEISRRKRDILITKPGSPIVDLIRIDDNMDLSGNAPDIVLQPFDIITIKENPFYKEQISVKISGEIMMPAVYTLQSREERLSSLIKRSGGLLYTADIRGAKLVRKVKIESIADTSHIKHLLAVFERDTTKSKDSVLQKKTRDVAIDLQYILSHPGSNDDITLEEGDELIVPRINNTVSINGEVFKPLDIMYERSKSMDDYISDAGGVTLSGKKGRSFVIYPNGSSARVRRPLGVFYKYPEILPGTAIYVPQKPKRGTLDVGRAGILVSAITGLLTAIALLTR